MDPLNQTTPTTPGNGEKKIGPIIGTLIIVLVLIIVALYIFASKISQTTMPDDGTVTTDQNSAGTNASSTTSVVPVTSTSTDTGSLQNDLNNATKGLDNQNF